MPDEIQEGEVITLYASFEFSGSRCLLYVGCNGETVQTQFGQSDFGNIADSVHALLKGLFRGNDERSLLLAARNNAPMFVETSEPTPENSDQEPPSTYEELKELNETVEEINSDSTESGDSGVSGEAGPNSPENSDSNSDSLNENAENNKSETTEGEIL